MMARLVHRDFSMAVANFGDVVNTRRPSEFRPKRKSDSDSVVNQDAQATNVQVPLDQHIYVSFTIKDGESSMAFQDLVQLYLQPAAKEIASAVDKVIVGQAHKFLANTAGRLNEMTSSNAKDFVLEARQKMNQNKAYVNARNLVLSPTAETDILATELFIAANQRGDGGTALEEARLGRILGFDTYMDQNVSSVLLNGSGAYTAGATIAAAAIGATTISVNIPAYAAIDGEFVHIAGEGKPHIVSSAADDGTNTNSIVLTTGLESAVANAAAVTVWEAYKVDNTSYAAGYAKQIRLQGQDDGATLMAPPQLGQLLAFGTGVSRHTYTIIDAEVDPDSANDYLVMLDRPLVSALADNDYAFPGPQGSYNLAFHRNALALVTRPLAMPASSLGVSTSVGVYNDIAMRAAMQYNITSQGTIVTLDLLCGVALLDANLGCVLLS